MRAVIAFKWQAYGRRRWLWTAWRMLALVASYAAGLSLLLGEPTIWHILAGAPCYALTFAINLQRAYEESVQLRHDVPLKDAASLREYTAAMAKLDRAGWLDFASRLYSDYLDFWNVTDMLSIVVVASEGVLLLLQLPAARTLGAMGMLLLLFPMMQAMRGSERLSRLVQMLEAIVRDMLPFVGCWSSPTPPSPLRCGWSSTRPRATAPPSRRR